MIVLIFLFGLIYLAFCVVNLRIFSLGYFCSLVFELMCSIFPSVRQFIAICMYRPPHFSHSCVTLLILYYRHLQLLYLFWMPNDYLGKRADNSAYINIPFKLWSRLLPCLSLSGATSEAFPSSDQNLPDALHNATSTSHPEEPRCWPDIPSRIRHNDYNPATSINVHTQQKHLQ